MPEKKGKLLFLLTIVFLGISSAAILLMAKADFNGGHSQILMARIAALTFWLGLLFGWMVWAYLNVLYRKAIKKRRLKKRKNAFICFFSNKYARVTDWTLIISFGLNMIGLFTPIGKGLFGAILITVFIFTFHMHYILNGKIYRELFERKRERRMEKNEEDMEFV